jgi:hypothetical protein
VVGLELRERSALSSAGLKVMMSEIRSRVKTKVFSTAADIYGINLRSAQQQQSFCTFLFACCLLALAFSFFLLMLCVMRVGRKMKELRGREQKCRELRNYQ